MGLELWGLCNQEEGADKEKRKEHAASGFEFVAHGVDF